MYSTSDLVPANGRGIKAESLEFRRQRDRARSVIVKAEPARFEGKLEVHVSAVSSGRDFGVEAAHCYVSSL